MKLAITDRCENKIIIGEPCKNEYVNEFITQSEFEKLVPGPEGFMIYAKGNNILLSGNSKKPNEKEYSVTTASDETGELWHMQKKFGSHLINEEG